MDLPNLSVILRAALSPNSDERNAAEQSLSQFQYAPKHLVMLLEIIFDSNCDLAVRQVASIHFKNFIAKYWTPMDPGEALKISPDDKAIARDHILVFVAHVPPLLRVQLGECLKTIIRADYPEQWPQLLDWVKHNLQSQEVYGSLFVLEILFKKYEFKSDDERTPVHRIVDETFPHLLNIFNSLAQFVSAQLLVADFIKLICKIFWYSIKWEIPKQLFDPNVFNAWMTLFLNILVRPVPVEGQPVDPELRKSWGLWKVKKWTIHILNRVHTELGDLMLQNPENRALAQMFQKNYAEKILECYLDLLNVIRVDGYLPEKIINLILQYLSHSISNNSMYNLLQSRMDVLLFEIVFPLMCFNDNDQQLWDEDPHEYVRKGYDTFEDFCSPRNASKNFVSELVRKSGKVNLPKFIQFIIKIFKRYDEAPVQYKPYRQKDGALLAIGTLCDELKETEPYKSELELMLMQHVFPEFSCPVGHLRAKAVWVVGQYADINFADQNNFLQALHRVVSGMRDPELPVRVDSVYALRPFVEVCRDLNEIRPILPQLLNECFKLMNEVESEDIVFTLETIVDKFGKEMAPYALGLCENLAAAFWRCMNTDADSGALAAVGCLRAISTTLKAVSRLPDLFVQIELILLPIMRRMLTTDGRDVFEEVLEVASLMTLFSPMISLELWRLWPLMMEALTDWALDFFPDIMFSLVNYISRGTAQFLSCKNPDYQQSLWNVISYIMGHASFGDRDIVSAPKLIGAVFQNCKGRVDHWAEPYIRITVERLVRTEESYLKRVLIQVIADALFYNAALTFSILHKLGVAAEIFSLWFHMMQQVKRNGSRLHFTRERDKKVCCLGLISVLALPADQLPGDDLAVFFKNALDLLAAYGEQVAAGDNDVCNGEIMLSSAIDEVDAFILFVDTIKVMQASDSGRLESLMQTLDSRYQVLANGIAQLAERRRASSAS